MPFFLLKSISWIFSPANEGVPELLVLPSEVGALLGKHPGQQGDRPHPLALFGRLELEFQLGHDRQQDARRDQVQLVDLWAETRVTGFKATIRCPSKGYVNDQARLGDCKRDRSGLDLMGTIRH